MKKNFNKLHLIIYQILVVTNNHCLIIQVKITTFRHIHFYLLFDVSSVTTLIVKKLL